MKTWFAFPLVLGLFVAVIGCGGGGGGGTTTSTTATGVTTGLTSGTATSVFISNGASSPFTHDWISIKKVELLNGPTATVVFTNPNGVQVDLANLSDGGGARFMLLSNPLIPAGSYTQVRVTLSKDLIIFQGAATTAAPVQFAGFDVPTSTKVLTFAAAVTIPSANPIIVDFRDATWSLNAGLVTASLGAGNPSGLDDPSRQEICELSGQVSAFGGGPPTDNFNLSSPTFGTVPCTTDVTTSAFNDDGTPSPVVANGKVLEVRGVFSIIDNRFLTSSLKIVHSTPPQEVVGLPGSNDPLGGTFDLGIVSAQGFLPTGTHTVATAGPSTLYFGSSGIVITKAEFFGALATSSSSEADGSYDSSTHILTSSAVRLNDISGGQVRLTGGPSTIDSVAGTFNLNLTKYEGVLLAVGGTVNVQTGGATNFIVNGSPTTSAAFYTALAGASSVQIDGVYDATLNLAVALTAKIGP